MKYGFMVIAATLLAINKEKGERTRSPDAQ
jgi:hypothetical protein